LDSDSDSDEEQDQDQEEDALHIEEVNNWTIPGLTTNESQEGNWSIPGLTTNESQEGNSIASLNEEDNFVRGVRSFVGDDLDYSRIDDQRESRRELGEDAIDITQILNLENQATPEEIEVNLVMDNSIDMVSAPLEEESVSAPPEEFANKPSIDQLRKMNINQLKTIASQLGISTDISKMKKPELISLIRGKDA
jgi:hypothetical protein